MTSTESNPAIKDLIYLNLATLFIGTSGVLGRYISMPPEITIFWRSFLAMILLVFLCTFRKVDFLKGVKSDSGILTLGGFLMMVHWVAYFYSLQLSNVAIGMLSLFTYPVITAFLEPLILKTRFKWMHLLLAMMTLAGIYFLVPNVDFGSQHMKALGFGLLSATSYSLRNILMKKPVQRHDGSKLMFYQTLVTSLILFPFLFTKGIGNIGEQWWAILFLALFTTVIGHTLFIMSFKKFSITTASIISCTQPIFGIILGMIFLGEIPPLTTVIGGTLILASIVIESRSLKVV